jgi:hypothetical protein
MTITYSSAITNIWIDEYHWSGSSITLDGTPASTLTASSNSTKPGVAQALSGTHDVIVQMIQQTYPITAIDGTYTNPTDLGGIAYSQNGFAGSINTSSGAAPNWTTPMYNVTAVVASMAFQGN